MSQWACEQSDLFATDLGFQQVQCFKIYLTPEPSCLMATNLADVQAACLFAFHFIACIKAPQAEASAPGRSMWSGKYNLGSTSRCNLELLVHKPTMVTMTWQRCYASPGIWEMRSRWMRNCSIGCPAEEAGLFFQFFVLFGCMLNLFLDGPSLPRMTGSVFFPYSSESSLVMQVSLTWWLLESKSAATTGFRSGSQLRSAIPSDANLWKVVVKQPYQCCLVPWRKAYMLWKT